MATTARLVSGLALVLVVAMAVGVAAKEDEGVVEECVAKCRSTGDYTTVQDACHDFLTDFPRPAAHRTCLVGFAAGELTGCEETCSGMDTNTLLAPTNARGRETRNSKCQRFERQMPRPTMKNKCHAAFERGMKAGGQFGIQFLKQAQAEASEAPRQTMETPTANTAAHSAGHSTTHAAPAARSDPSAVGAVGPAAASASASQAAPKQPLSHGPTPTPASSKSPTPISTAPPTAAARAAAAAAPAPGSIPATATKPTTTKAATEPIGNTAAAERTAARPAGENAPNKE